MAGTHDGGRAAAETNKRRYGSDFYKKIGGKGGAAGRTGGFAAQDVGDDGLTGRQRASIYGKIGGHKSRRTKLRS